MHSDTIDIYVTGPISYGKRGPLIYQVMVDGKVYATLASSAPLTNSDMIDVARGYREGLTGIPAIPLTGPLGPVF